MSITSMITDIIKRLEPVNHNRYNFRKKKHIHLRQTSLVETISKRKNPPYWKFPRFFIFKIKAANAPIAFEEIVVVMINERNASHRGKIIQNARNVPLALIRYDTDLDTPH